MGIREASQAERDQLPGMIERSGPGDPLVDSKGRLAGTVYAVQLTPQEMRVRYLAQEAAAGRGPSSMGAHLAKAQQPDVRGVAAKAAAAQPDVAPGLDVDGAELD